MINIKHRLIVNRLKNENLIVKNLTFHDGFIIKSRTVVKASYVVSPIRNGVERKIIND